MRHSDDITKVVASFEGLRLLAYQDGNGIWTLGYGRIQGVKEGDTCTPEQALAWLDADMQEADNAVNTAIRGELTQWQYDACVSLAFNIGWGNFGHSTVCKDINAGFMAAAAASFVMWNKIGGQVSAGLERRREAERDIFLGKGYLDLYPVAVSAADIGNAITQTGEV